MGGPYFGYHLPFCGKSLNISYQMENRSQQWHLQGIDGVGDANERLRQAKPQVSLEASLKRSDGSMFKQSLVRTVGLSRIATPTPDIWIPNSLNPTCFPPHQRSSPHNTRLFWCLCKALLFLEACSSLHMYIYICDICFNYGMKIGQFKFRSWRFS